MTVSFVCARCHKTFEEECEEATGLPSCAERFNETEPVCEECEHAFLAWGGCHALI